MQLFIGLSAFFVMGFPVYLAATGAPWYTGFLCAGIATMWYRMSKGRDYITIMVNRAGALQFYGTLFLTMLVLCFVLFGIGSLFR